MQSEIVEKCVKSAMLSVIKEHPIGHWNDDQVEEVARRAITEAALSAAEPQPAPSVAVKALASEIKKLEVSYHVGECMGLADWAAFEAGITKGLEAAAEKVSALSAQVQDVAARQSQVTHEDICNTHEGGPCNCDWSAADEYQAHPDDIAVDRFAAVMKAKLAKKRDEGRGGWEDKDECSLIFLSQLLREHVEKGDPVDVGNLAMMLHQRGERIASLLEALQGE